MNGRKRSLTNVGGRVERRGEPTAAALLARALDVEPGAGVDRWTHGFHSYPARMHPDTAARLVKGLTPATPGQVVLDPFCGSGTVVLEAVVAGRRAVGRDLSPLAIRLARLRCAVTSETQRRALRDEAGRIATAAVARTRAGRPPEGAGPDPDEALFDQGTWLQLEWLRALVAADRDPFAQEALSLVLSSLLIKLSSQVSDTDRRVQAQPRAWPAGAAAHLFRDKAQELSRMLKELSKAARTSGEHRTARPDLEIDDARSLASVADGSIDAVITSPPYPNVYDYAEHHALRARWLGLEDDSLRRGEIGARRSFAHSAERGLEQWEADGEAWVAAVARTLRPGGRAAVLGGDGATRLGPVRFDENLARWAARGGLRIVAGAAQRRPVWNAESRRAFRGGAPREHLVLLERPAPGSANAPRAARP
jgi:SAM-dependent methyltransferase